MKSRKQQAQEDAIDFKGILYKFLSRWWYFAIAAVVAYAFAKVYIKYQEVTYRVSTTLLINDESDASKKLVGLDVYSENKNLHNEIGLIKSFDMVLGAVRELDFDVSYYYGNIRTSEFYKDAPFRIELDTTTAQVINVPFFVTILPGKKIKIQSEVGGQPLYDRKNNIVAGVAERVSINAVLDSGQTFQNKNFKFKVHLINPYFRQKEAKLYFIINDLNRLAQAFKNKLAVYPTNKESSILELAVTGPLVQKDIDFLNKLTEVYIKSGLEEKNKIATNTINFIDKQLAEISGNLNLTGTDIENFRATNKILNLSDEAGSDFEQLEALEKEKANYELNLKYYDYIVEYVNAKKEIEEMVAPSAMGIPDPILGSLIGQLISLKSERKVITANTTSKNPYLISLDQKIENTTQALIENLNNIVKSTKITLSDLSKRINTIEKSLNKIPKKERQLMDLQRRYNLSDHLYNFLLERKEEAKITKESNKEDNKVLDRASILNSFQIGPKTDLIFTSCFMLGLVIPFLIIVISDFLNDKIYSPDELSKVTNIPLLGIVGHSEKPQNLIVVDEPKSAIAEMFRSIRINLQYLAVDKTQKVVGITSSISGEGKTFCSINLASIIAMSGKRTILIGTDLRKPKIFNDFNLTNERGLSSYLSNQHQLKDIIFQTRVNNLDVITAGPIPPNPSELLSSAKTQEMFNILKEKYDFIVVDSAPLGIVSDYMVLHELMDINIYVVRHNYTHKKQLEKINDLFESNKIKNISILINDIKGMVGNYYYGYNYNYGYYEESEKKGMIGRIKKLKTLISFWNK